MGCVPDDDELGILRALLDVVRHDGHVLEVEGRVDLVHHVQRGRLHTRKGAAVGSFTKRSERNTPGTGGKMACAVLRSMHTRTNSMPHPLHNVS